jgi:uncharacterized RDD family membrane protein YckC
VEPAERTGALASILWLRAFAAIGDYVTVAGLVLVLFIASDSAAAPLRILAGVLILIVYSAVAEAMFGRTLWKAAFGLRVVAIDGSAITPGQATVRNVLRLIDLLPAFYGVGGIVMLTVGNGRRLGDLAAGTGVVRNE